MPAAIGMLQEHRGLLLLRCCQQCQQCQKAYNQYLCALQAENAWYGA
jgi:hypothetical protein